MNCLYTYLILFFLFIVDLPALQATQSGKNFNDNAKVLSLKKAIQLALENNPGYQASRYATEAAQWGVKKAAFDFLPKIAVNFNYSRLDAGTVHRANIFTDIGRSLVKQFAPGTDPNEIRPAAWRNAYGTSVSVQQPIFNGGALKAQLSLAQANASGAQYTYFEKRQEIILKTMQAYYNVVKATEFLALAKQTTEASHNKLEKMRRMFDVGLRNRAEVLRWEVALASDEGHLVEAENNVALTQAGLAQITGIPVDSTLHLAIGDFKLAEKLKPLPYYLALGKQRHPVVKALAATVDLQQAQVQFVRANFFPKVNLVYNYLWETNNTLALDSFKTWTFGIGVHIPLFNSFVDYARLQEAKARLAQMKKTREDFFWTLELQIRQAYSNVQTAAKRVVIAQKGVELAQENLRVINNSFSVGMVANIDVLDSQIAATQAQANLIQARYDYLLAIAQLKKATGTLEF